MGKEIMTWREWELTDIWTGNDKCPECGEPLIITHIVSPGINSYDNTDIHNGICINCRKQYSVCTHAGTLTVNEQAARQQDRLDALEERIAKLEQRILALEQAKQVNPVSTPIQQEEPEAADFKKKYSYLF